MEKIGHRILCKKVSLLVAILVAIVCTNLLFHNSEMRRPSLWTLVSGFSGEFELRGADYECYCREVDTNDFDPKGARNIFYATKFGRDSGVAFRSFQIREIDYKQILEQRKQKKRGEGRHINRGINLQRLSIQDSHVPKWWSPPNEAGRDIETVTFDCADGKSELWVFDQRVLWILNSW